MKGGEELEARACELRALGFQWAALCFAYPTELTWKAQNDLIGYLGDLLLLSQGAGDLPEMGAHNAWGPICSECQQVWGEQLNARSLEDRQVSYLRLFKRVTPYESEYTAAQALLPTDNIADVAGFRAFGFQVREGAERPDHIGAELQFMALLALKEKEARQMGNRQSVEVCIEAQRKFLGEHLGPFVLAMEKRLSEDPERNGSAREWVSATRLARALVEQIAREWEIAIVPPESTANRIIEAVADSLQEERIDCPFASSPEGLSEE